MPERQHRRLVVVGRDDAHRRAGPEVGEVVAVDARKRRRRQLAEQHHVRQRARGGRLGDETRSRHRDRFLREQPRQIVGARGEVDAPLAARGDVLEELRVGVRLAAEPDDADGDAERL